MTYHRMCYWLVNVKSFFPDPYPDHIILFSEGVRCSTDCAVWTKRFYRRTFALLFYSITVYSSKTNKQFIILAFSFLNLPCLARARLKRFR